MCVPVQWVARNPAGVITHVGGATDRGTPWGLTVQEAIDLQESRHYSWYVEVPAGKRVPLMVRRTGGGRPYLTTSPDGIQANNLDSLPNMPHPLGGVEPPFPLNIPGTWTVSLMSVDSVTYSLNSSVPPITSSPLTMPWGDRAGEPTPEFQPPATFWRQAPRALRLACTLPFPADYQVSLNGVSGPNVMRWVPQDALGTQQSIQQAGGGWWTHEFVLTDALGNYDPRLPARLTPVRVLVYPGTRAWATGRINITLVSRSINPHCEGNSSGAYVSFTIRKPAVTTPSQPPKQTVVVPSVVGQRLDVASRAIWGLGLGLTTLGPVGVAADLQVDSQSPVGGTTVTLPKGVTLSTSFAAAPKGTKQLVITNQSNRAKPLDIWLRDTTTGQWSKETTVDYQRQESVSLSDGHTYLVAAVDRTLNSCSSGTPDEVTCVYSFPQTVFVGDDDGLDVPWVIT